ncbi:methyltransferase domain-containing protein [Pseudomonas aeruginosa]|nr:methyltransferase domain-containing protein [Pseudomonas aeruginosa]MCT0513809.1 methyltransferase domain-containing protein [Pseudomonas aeruginosa]MCT0563495.1 methyltransferase domain-containing protein [Pseudomonas aeruginosa]MCT1035270.1 methyltransferase domain-containing protein [Pseudomonas aeruginosa]MCT1072139.1 methyltransferase domain-containing protein [Pseudomonas aeruginosa]
MTIRQKTIDSAIKNSTPSTLKVYSAETSRTLRNDIWYFFKAWCLSPLQTAAITPSGPALAQLITSEIFSTTGKVLELGPGTGSFTRAILNRGIREAGLTLVEKDAFFAQLLSERFPDAEVFQTDASSLSSGIHFQAGSFGAVVSGLPLLSMGTRTTLRILSRSFAALEPGGSFYQFTYGLSCPIPRKVLYRLGLKAVRIGGTFANIPPARVYRISRLSTPKKILTTSSGKDT